MLYTHRNFPAVRQESLEGAQLFATRADMIRAISPRHGVIAEVGVALGDFSQFLIETLNPRAFFAMDLFNLDTHEIFWGQPSAQLLSNQTHLEFYRKRLAHLPSQVYLEIGPSAESLAKQEDQSFDLIYIDAGHSYDDVKADADQAKTKVKPDGQLIFNDYVLIDPLAEIEYGVVQVVNELLATGDWKVIGFALEKNMFCDISLARA